MTIRTKSHSYTLVGFREANDTLRLEIIPDDGYDAIKAVYIQPAETDHIVVSFQTNTERTENHYEHYTVLDTYTYTEDKDTKRAIIVLRREDLSERNSREIDNIYQSIDDLMTNVLPEIGGDNG